ncbi:RimJ/RimL family protein N-acetyltransferase [Bacillus mesophilus]|uniref:GNAT family N-acetyltransferase n=1 Tax=Bacillus mesophilus TaxID=1808955 RepID=A0A6M0Q9C8_9BACI|nr:GNAT family N-acetyltransferase [Bacillus mesophilus]MBM7661687.1 RimJ/RimL family protein N-acetyltransferase [Bacillus mesophilus]NEY72349.1 GNAT family N-acetyltransferase [Bacillus mesophilus]
MNKSNYIIETPWDKKVFGMPTYEVQRYSEETLNQIKDYHGHFTLKVDPMVDKRLLHKHDFYYADTLLEPFCKRDHFVFHYNEHVKLNYKPPLNKLMEICMGGTFEHGRFHKDFFLSSSLGDQRYASWLEQLHSSGKAIALMFNDEIAGFFCSDNNKILLHALDEKFRGKGLAKYFWATAIEQMFQDGYHDVSSSVSASNIPVINLYISLGFKFNKVVEVYHKYTKQEE